MNNHVFSIEYDKEYKYKIQRVYPSIGNPIYIGKKDYQFNREDKFKWLLKNYSKSFENPNTKRFWYRWILNFKPSLEVCIKNIRTKFNIEVIDLINEPESQLQGIKEKIKTVFKNV